MTDQSTEIEIKLALTTVEDYLKLLAYIGDAESKRKQINIFYDTPDHKISLLGFALRLRIEPTRGIVTLKSTTVQKGKAAVRKEIEEIIPLDIALDLQQEHNFDSLDIPSINFLHSRIENLKELRPILTFENVRIQKAITLAHNSYSFEIDKTTYSNDSVIYELEVELAHIDKIDIAATDLEKLFSELDIEFKVQKKSKFEHALEFAGLI